MPRAYDKSGHHAPHIVAITLLVLAGFLIKALIPAGFMPAVPSHGLVEMVVCSGMGEKTILVHEDGSPAHKGEQKPSSSKLCDYHFLTGQKNLTVTDAVLVSAPLMQLRLTDEPPEQRLLSTRLSSFIARGPPIFLI